MICTFHLGVIDHFVCTPRPLFFFAFASHLAFQTSIFIHIAPSEKRMTSCVCPLVLLCLLLDREWTMAGWQLAPRCPPWSAVVCCTVSHCCRGSQWGHRQAILDRNSNIPLSNQTNTTLKVNKNPEWNTDNIRAAGPLFVCGPGVQPLFGCCILVRFYMVGGSCDLISP